MAIPNQTQASVAQTTSLGAAYTRYYVTPPASGDPMQILVPASVGDSGPARIVLYAHGRTGTQDQINTGARAAMRNALLDAGYVILSPYLHGDTWGNRQCQDDINAAFTLASSVWTVTHRLEVGVSMSGNTVGMSYALGETLLDAVVFITPSVSLQASWDRNDQARTSLRTAFDAAVDGSDFAAKTATWDALRQPTSEWSGIRTRVFASPGDSVVSFTNTVQPFVSNLVSFGADVQLIETSGDHDSFDNYRGSEIASFFDSVSVTPPDPEPQVAPKVYTGSGWVAADVRVFTQSGWRDAMVTAYS